MLVERPGRRPDVQEGSRAQGAATGRQAGRPVQRLAQRELVKAGQVLDLPCLLRTFEVLIGTLACSVPCGHVKSSGHPASGRDEETRRAKSPKSDRSESGIARNYGPNSQRTFNPPVTVQATSVRHPVLATVYTSQPRQQASRFGDRRLRRADIGLSGLK